MEGGAPLHERGRVREGPQTGLAAIPDMIDRMELLHEELMVPLHGAERTLTARLLASAGGTYSRALQALRSGSGAAGVQRAINEAESGCGRQSSAANPAPADGGALGAESPGGRPMGGRGLGFLSRRNRKVSPAGVDGEGLGIVHEGSLEHVTSMNIGRPGSAPRATRGSAKDVVTPVSRLGTGARTRAPAPATPAPHSVPLPARAPLASEAREAPEAGDHRSAPSSHV